jgi:hypothetical protein
MTVPTIALKIILASVARSKWPEMRTKDCASTRQPMNDEATTILSKFSGFGKPGIAKEAMTSINSSNTQMKFLSKKRITLVLFTTVPFEFVCIFILPFVFNTDLIVYQLPSYSPGYNPIEYLWKKIKTKATHNRYFAEFVKVVQSVEDALNVLATQADGILRLMGVYSKHKADPLSAWPFLNHFLNLYSREGCSKRSFILLRNLADWTPSITRWSTDSERIIRGRIAI